MRVFLISNIELIQKCCFFFVTLIGAVTTQLLSCNSKAVGATPFLKMWFSKKSNKWYFRANCIILVLCGTCLSFIILEPNTIKSSFCAGLTWCGTFQSLGLATKSNIND